MRFGPVNRGEQLMVAPHTPEQQKSESSGLIAVVFLIAMLALILLAAIRTHNLSSLPVSIPFGADR